MLVWYDDVREELSAPEGVLKEHTYRYARHVFLCCLGAIYFVAFAGVIVQFEGLYSKNGLLSVQTYYEFITSFPFSSFPTWARCHASFGMDVDSFLYLLCLLGLLLSVVAVCGFAVSPLMFVLWFLYLSLQMLGLVFLELQPDTLLCEVGFLGVLMAPLAFPGRRLAPPRVAHWLVRFCLFKVNIMTGAGKLLSSDAVWMNLSALQYHFAIEVLPTPLAWYFHQCPHAIKTLAAAFTLSVQVFGCFLIILPFRSCMVTAAICQLVLQTCVILSGNYGPYAPLLLVLTATLIDDTFWRHVLAPLPQEETERDSDVDESEDPKGTFADAKPSESSEGDRLLNGGDRLPATAGQRGPLSWLSSTMLVERFEALKTRPLFLLRVNSGPRTTSIVFYLSLTLIFLPALVFLLGSHVLSPRFLAFVISIVVVKLGLWLLWSTFLDVMPAACVVFHYKDACRFLTSSLNIFSSVLLGVIAIILLAGNSAALCDTFSTSPTAFAASAHSFASPYHVVNSYGQYAAADLNMVPAPGNSTEAHRFLVTRPELIIQGSNDTGCDKNSSLCAWEDYEFSYKPGDIYSSPPWILGYLPRLDWHMWFAAQQVQWSDFSWMKHLLQHLIRGTPAVTALLSPTNVFTTSPPAFIRVLKYQYVFTTYADDWTQWWKRGTPSDFSPVLTLSQLAMSSEFGHNDYECKNKVLCAVANFVKSHPMLVIWLCVFVMILIGFAPLLPYTKALTHFFELSKPQRRFFFAWLFCLTLFVCLIVSAATTKNFLLSFMASGAVGFAGCVFVILRKHTERSRGVPAMDSRVISLHDSLLPFCRKMAGFFFLMLFLAVIFRASLWYWLEMLCTLAVASSFAYSVYHLYTLGLLCLSSLTIMVSDTMLLWASLFIVEDLRNVH